MDGNLASRVRGNYSSLICANCSTRKVKCHFEDAVHVVPSDKPQDQSNACQRCQRLSIPCVVRHTVLGRPASKRKRANDEGLFAESIPHSQESTSLDEDDIRGVLLAELPDDRDQTLQDNQSRHASTNDMLDALLSPAHFIATVLSRNRTFGTAAVCAAPVPTRPLPNLISHGLATLLDESLRWHRFYLPLTPLLVDLRNELTTGTDQHSATTLSLFALLALLALDAPSTHLRDDPHLRLRLRTDLKYYGREWLLSLPTSRQTLALLLLLYFYRPHGLAFSQREAVLAVKSGLYITLAYQVSYRLGFGDLATPFQSTSLINKREDHPQKSMPGTSVSIETYLVDALTWCEISVQETLTDRLVHNPIVAVREIMARIQPIMLNVTAVIRSPTPLGASTIYHFTFGRSLLIGLEMLLSADGNWRSLNVLRQLLVDHAVQASQLRLDANRMLDQAIDSAMSSAIDVGIVRMHVDARIKEHEVLVAGLAIFYALMSWRHCEVEANKDELLNVSPKDAVQLHNDIIRYFLEVPQTADILEFTTFLGDIGEQRTNQIEDILSDFAAIPDAGATWLPPPRRTALDVLYHGKTLVENSASRMKGWKVLHPNVDRHATLLVGCAARLEKMSRGTSQSSLTLAFNEGCLYAASARLLRSLNCLLVRWKSSMEAAASTASQQEGTFAPIDFAKDGVDETLLNMDFDDLFAQWSDDLELSYTQQHGYS